MEVSFRIDDLVPEGLPTSFWSETILPRRIELLTSDLDTQSLSELGAIGLAEEFSHAARVAATAAANYPDPPQVGDPLIIGGLPRTGTTYLQGLLSTATGRRTLYGWEAYDPRGASDPARRSIVAQEAADRFRAALEVAPRLYVMHPLSADGIEECTPLLQHSFECLQWAMMFDCPSYLDWLADASLEQAYRLWSAQLHQIDPNADSWLLKSPMHCCDYAALFAAAPSAKLIHIRRDAVDIVTSLLNLCLEARRVFATDVTDLPMMLGPFWLPRLRMLLDRAQRDLDSLRLPLAVVDYPELISHPAATTKYLCEVLGVDLAPDQGARRDAVPRTPQAANSPIESFGIDAKSVGKVLADHLGGPFLLP